MLNAEYWAWGVSFARIVFQNVLALEGSSFHEDVSSILPLSVLQFSSFFFGF